MEETVQTTNEGYNKRPLWQWLVVYVILGAIIYGAAYYFFPNKNNGYSSNSSTEYPTPSSPATAISNETTVILKPVNDSNEAGTAILTEEDEQTKVVISLTGYIADVEQPAHIHIGICPGVGAVKYPLTSIVNGVSETLLSVTLESLKKELPLAINVHKSATEVSVYTACGPLSLQ